MLTVSQEPRDAPAALGDPDRWVDRYGESLMRFAVARVVDTATAEDLVQETLLAAWRGRAGFDGGCAPLTWMTAILRRRIADHFRRIGRRSESAGDSEPQAECCNRSPARSTESAEFWAVVTACTSELPAHLARAFRLRTFADRDPGLICETEGISRKNLSVRLHRARQLLRRCLQARWFDDPAPNRQR